MLTTRPHQIWPLSYLSDRSNGHGNRCFVFLDPFNVGTDGGQLLLDFFVAPIDVIDPIDFGGAASDQAGEYEGGAGSQVAGHYAGPLEFLDALDDGGGPFLTDSGAHAVEFADMEEAIGEDALGDDADAVSQAEQSHELGLEVGGEAGVWLGRHFHGIQAARAVNEDGAVLALDANADFIETIGDGNEVIQITVFELEFSIGDGSGEDECAAFDAVRYNAVLGADEFIDAFYADFGGAVAFDVRAHLNEQLGAVGNFGLARSADEDGFALRERCGTHYINGSKDGWSLSATKIHSAAF